MLLMTGWENGGREDRRTVTVEETVRAIDDVIAMAIRYRCDLYSTCSTLNRVLREDVWRSITGKTFWERLAELIARGNSVKILVSNAIELDHPASAGMTELIDALNRAGNGDRLRIVYAFSGPAEEDPTLQNAWEHFPHFTVVPELNSSGTSVGPFAYVEWPDARSDHPDRGEHWRPLLEISGEAYGRSEMAKAVAAPFIEKLNAMVQAVQKSRLVGVSS